MSEKKKLCHKTNGKGHLIRFGKHKQVRIEREKKNWRSLIKFDFDTYRKFMVINKWELSKIKKNWRLVRNKWEKTEKTETRYTRFEKTETCENWVRKENEGVWLSLTFVHIENSCHNTL